ncbi:MAG: universal stress protein [Gemmatimonadales bacterium]|nr:universal stress protein [Gemmatimonadales bacterium]
MPRPPKASSLPVVDPSGLDSLVLATDFSPGAEAAVRRAALLPFVGKASIHLIHVLPSKFDRAADSLVRDVAQQHLDEARQALEASLVARNRSDIRVKARLIRGAAPEEIGRLSDQVEADLVVLGRRGTPVLRALLLGSVAQRVARQARVPVLVVAKAPRTPYRRVVVGFDLSDDALRVASLAGRLAPGDARVEAVYAYREVLSGTPTPASARRAAAAELAATRAKIERSLHAAIGGKGDWPVQMLRGDPRQVILEAADEQKADLIAMGSMGRTGLRRQMIGSVAEGVLQLAKVDVLIAPRRDSR